MTPEVLPTVADLIVSGLRGAGARALFGVPGGGGNLDLIEAAGRIGLPFVLTSTETGAAIAAMAQAEITGRPGACLTTLGPGAASIVERRRRARCSIARQCSCSRTVIRRRCERPSSISGSITRPLLAGVTKCVRHAHGGERLRDSRASDGRGDGTAAGTGAPGLSRRCGVRRGAGTPRVRWRAGRSSTASDGPRPPARIAWRVTPAVAARRPRRQAS